MLPLLLLLGVVVLAVLVVTFLAARATGKGFDEMGQRYGLTAAPGLDLHRHTELPEFRKNEQQSTLFPYRGSHEGLELEVGYYRHRPPPGIGFYVMAAFAFVFEAIVDSALNTSRRSRGEGTNQMVEDSWTTHAVCIVVLPPGVPAPASDANVEAAGGKVLVKMRVKAPIAPAQLDDVVKRALKVCRPRDAGAALS